MNSVSVWAFSLAPTRALTIEDIADVDPQHGHVPLELASEWLRATLNERLRAVALERAEGLVQTAGRSYTTLDEDSRGLTASTLAFLGDLNHDPEMFKPPRPRRAKGEPPLSKVVGAMDTARKNLRAP